MELARLIEVAVDTVGGVQRKLPPEIRALARSVAVHYENVAADELLAEGFEPDILGLFTGSPHGEELSAENPSPPQILLYIESLWDFAEGDIAVFRDEVRLTYLHELGHYLGWDEDELAHRGLE